MEFVDERTKEQKESHPLVVLGTDTFLSGWGRAENGASYAGWACRLEDEYKVERWVRNRGDMIRLRFVGKGYRPNPFYCAHCHIYVVGEDHPALR